MADEQTSHWAAEGGSEQTTAFERDLRHTALEALHLLESSRRFSSAPFDTTTQSQDQQYFTLQYIRSDHYHATLSPNRGEVETLQPPPTHPSRNDRPDYSTNSPSWPSSKQGNGNGNDDPSRSSHRPIQKRPLIHLERPDTQRAVFDSLRDARQDLMRSTKYAMKTRHDPTNSHRHKTRVQILREEGRGDGNCMLRRPSGGESGDLRHSGLKMTH